MQNKALSIVLCSGCSSNTTDFNSGASPTTKPKLLYLAAELPGGTESEILRSTDNGFTWSRSDSGIAGHNYSAIFADSLIVIAASDSGISRSSDGGVHWIAVADSLVNKKVESFIKTNNALLAITLYGGVYRSTDEGQSWHQRSKTHVMRADFNNFAIIGIDGDNLLLSIDDGLTWGKIATVPNLYWLQDVSSSGNSWLISTAENGAGYGRICRSSDSGKSWKIVVDSFIAMAFARNETCTFAISSKFIFRSNDEGKTWIKSTLPISTHGRSIKCASESVFIYDNNKLYHSNDNGQTWTDCSNGLTGIDRIECIGAN